jgi:hypothetical protein
MILSKRCETATKAQIEKGHAHGPTRTSNLFDHATFTPREQFCNRYCSNKNNTHTQIKTTGQTCGCQSGSVEDQPQCPGL